MFDKNRLEALREKYPRQALELDLVSGRVNPETGEVNPDHSYESMQDLMELNVLEVYDLIDKQGHSGFSHAYMMGLLIPLLKGLPITPLTGKDWEWESKTWLGKDEYQNRRCWNVYKEHGEAYNSDGYAFSDNGGDCFYTSSDSHKPIAFPCKSKDLETEYVILNKEADNA